MSTDKNLIDQFKSMSLDDRCSFLSEAAGSLNQIEMKSLVDKLQEEWGVSAAVMSAGPAAAPVAAEEEVEERAEYELFVKSFEKGSKLSIIKQLREIQEWGIQQAKAFADAVEAGTAQSLGSFKTEDAKNHQSALTKAGAVVELK